MGEHIVEWFKRAWAYGKAESCSPLHFPDLFWRRKWVIVKLVTFILSLRRFDRGIRIRVSLPLCSALYTNLSSKWHSRHSCSQLLGLGPVHWIIFIWVSTAKCFTGWSQIRPMDVSPDKADLFELNATWMTGSWMSTYKMFAKVFGFLTADLTSAFKALTQAISKNERSMFWIVGLVSQRNYSNRFP